MKCLRTRNGSVLGDASLEIPSVCDARCNTLASRSRKPFFTLRRMGNALTHSSKNTTIAGSNVVGQKEPISQR